MNIHMVEPSNNFVKLSGQQWESGSWALEESKAKDLVGGEIYFHKKQQEPSFFGGTITEYRVLEDEQNQKKVVFTFQYKEDCRNVRTDKGGWSKRMKIVSHE